LVCFKNRPSPLKSRKKIHGLDAAPTGWESSKELGGVSDVMHLVGHGSSCEIPRNAYTCPSRPFL
jgi:hypothetical protein